MLCHNKFRLISLFVFFIFKTSLNTSKIKKNNKNLNIVSQIKAISGETKNNNEAYKLTTTHLKNQANIIETQYLFTVIFLKSILEIIRIIQAIIAKIKEIVELFENIINHKITLNISSNWA